MRVLVVGANGNVGGLVSTLLEEAGFTVVAMDLQPDKGDYVARGATYIQAPSVHEDRATPELEDAIKETDMIIPMLPAQLVLPVARATHAAGKHYIDPTEVVETTDAIRAMPENGRFMVPQSGLAPGFIGIVGGHLARKFDKGSLKDIKLMVGALPQKPKGRLGWASTWSPVGMIVECMEPCNVIIKGKPQKVPALGGKEDIEVNGEDLRAAFTSGGLGTIPETFYVSGEASYKTLRHPGHWRAMERILKRINPEKLSIHKLAAMIVKKYPPTDQDRVVVYAEVSGKQNGVEKTKKFTADFRPVDIAGQECTAIAWTTASGIVSVAELIRDNKLERDPGSNFVRQETIALSDFLGTSAGRLYAGQSNLLQDECKNGKTLL